MDRWNEFVGKEVVIVMNNNAPSYELLPCRLSGATDAGVFVVPTERDEEEIQESLREHRPGRFLERFYPWGSVRRIGLARLKSQDSSG